jgi:hypothetical protein
MDRATWAVRSMNLCVDDQQLNLYPQELVRQR